MEACFDRPTRWTGPRGVVRVLALAVAPGACAPGRAGLPAPSPIHAPTAGREVPTSSVEGGGISPSLLCLGCSGVTLGMGGGTVLGVVLFAATWPELAAGCAAACALAW